MTIAEALSQATGQLKEGNVPDPVSDSKSLVSFALSRDKTFLIAHPEYELTQVEKQKLHVIVDRRAAREPLQYILGRQEFFGLEFEVTQEVLIPRPETELLVERAISELKDLPCPRFCEIGIGSGCIAISILHDLALATAIAGDISAAAIQIARRNALKHKVDDRLELVESDIFSSIPDEQFDAILSNPPYVPEPDMATLQIEVRDHEPHTALIAGRDGLAIVSRIVAQAGPRLKHGGALFIEMGFNQSDRVAELLDEDLWADVEFLPDLQGIPRILFAQKR